MPKTEPKEDFRGKLFRTVTWPLIGALLAAVALMVVNTIGLAYIVANYLFPKGGGE